MESYGEYDILNQNINASSRKRGTTLACNIIFFVPIFIFQFILLYYSFKENDYMKNKEYMEWDKNLISEINVQSKIERYIEDDFDFDELDSSKPIKFNYSSDYSNEEDKVFIWNDYLFYAYRRSKEYNYIKLRTLDEKEENIKTKICGKDFYGNNLYYPIYEKCPINFIEINNIFNLYQKFF